MQEFRAYADLWRNKRYYYVLVRVFDTRSEMLKDINDCEFGPTVDRQAGQCSGLTHYNAKGRITGRFACMWLNREDLRNNAAEIVPHECLHAGMRHIRNLKTDIDNMEGEEVLAYTVGHLTAQINNRLHKLGVFA